MLPLYGIFPPVMAIPPCAGYDREKLSRLHARWLRLLRRALHKGAI